MFFECMKSLIIDERLARTAVRSDTRSSWHPHASHTSLCLFLLTAIRNRKANEISPSCICMVSSPLTPQQVFSKLKQEQHKIKAPGYSLEAAWPWTDYSHWPPLEGATPGMFLPPWKWWLSPVCSLFKPHQKTQQLQVAPVLGDGRLIS